MFDFRLGFSGTGGGRREVEGVGTSDWLRSRGPVAEIKGGKSLDDGEGDRSFPPGEGGKS